MDFNIRELMNLAKEYPRHYLLIIIYILSCCIPCSFIICIYDFEAYKSLDFFQLILLIMNITILYMLYTYLLSFTFYYKLFGLSGNIGDIREKNEEKLRKLENDPDDESLKKEVEESNKERQVAGFIHLIWIMFFSCILECISMILIWFFDYKIEELLIIFLLFFIVKAAFTLIIYIIKILFKRIKNYGKRHS